MTPLLFAAALALSPLPDAAAHPAFSSVVVSAGSLANLSPDEQHKVISALPTLDRQTLLQSGQLCQRKALQTLGPDHAPVTKLADLPPGLEEHAVLRMINGCAVREIVTAGGTYYLDAGPGQLERLDPTAYGVKQR